MSGVEAALIASTVLATGAAAQQGAQARADARKATRKAEEQTKVQEDLIKTQMAQEPVERVQADLGARRRQRALAGAALGRSSTILTGPLGLTTEPGTGAKTLLGA